MSTKFISLESMDILGVIPQYHIVLELFLFMWFIWFVVKKRYNEDHTAPSDIEVHEKLSEWIPESLIPETPENHPSLHPRQISKRVGKIITIDGIECLNLGTHNYLGFVESEEIEKKAIETINKYGVGSCGPRGFYGTVDVHLELEERLAKFTDTEEAVVYSYGFSTVASAISAYCKRKDLVFVDEKVNFAIQKGLDASRSEVRFFKHNNVVHLQKLLEEQAERDKRNLAKASKIKRFLIVEGIYMNTGELCPLPDLIKLCKKYKLRIFIDESISFGTLGSNGKGVTEHFNVPRHEIDMIMGSLEWAIGSIGGFCVGTSFIIDHQRLSGLGYCFSASLPPCLTTAAITSLDIMENNPELFKILKNNCLRINDGLKEIEYLETTSFPESPVKHLYLRSKQEPNKEKQLLIAISDKCIENNLAIISPTYLEAEKTIPRSSLRLCISVLLKENDIEFCLKILKNCVTEVLTQAE